MIVFPFGKESKWDFFVFGTNPGRITSNPKSNTRGNYIKTKISAKKLRTRFEAIDWQGNSCTVDGVAWFSKPEIVKRYVDEFEV